MGSEAYEDGNSVKGDHGAGSAAEDCLNSCSASDGGLLNGLVTLGVGTGMLYVLGLLYEISYFGAFGVPAEYVRVSYETIPMIFAEVLPWLIFMSAMVICGVELYRSRWIQRFYWILVIWITMAITYFIPLCWQNDSVFYKQIGGLLVVYIGAFIYATKNRKELYKDKREIPPKHPGAYRPILLEFIVLNYVLLCVFMFGAGTMNAKLKKEGLFLLPLTPTKGSLLVRNQGDRMVFTEVTRGNNQLLLTGKILIREDKPQLKLMSIPVGFGGLSSGFKPAKLWF